VDEGQADWVLTVLGVDVVAPGEDPDTPDLQESDAYRRYLLARLKQIRLAGSGSFGLALGGKGLQHRMALHPARSPRTMASVLVRQTHLRQVTWGTVDPHPEKPATLRLALQGKALAGLCKKGGAMLRAFRPLPFAHMVIVLNGKELPDILSVDDEADEGPISDLPPMPVSATRQQAALRNAAASRSALCEECPVT
jgi:hypothetical protein